MKITEDEFIAGFLAFLAIAFVTLVMTVLVFSHQEKMKDKEIRYDC